MTRVRALAVDDHPVNRLLIARQLDALGFDVDVVAGGVEALKRFGPTHYDLVVLDCAMPGMDGYEVARRMRDVEALSSRVPSFVVACTADSGRDTERRCIAAGMDACVSKPGSIHAFSECLAQWRGWSASAEDRMAMPTGMVGSRPARAPVDLEVLAESFGTDAIGSHAMLSDFVEFNAEDVQSLHAAVDDRDARAVARHAHRVLGASKMVGAAALARVAARLETLAATCDWRRITAVASVLVAECRRIEHFVADASGAVGPRGSK